MSSHANIQTAIDARINVTTALIEAAKVEAHKAGIVDINDWAAYAMGFLASMLRAAVGNEAEQEHARKFVEAAIKARGERV